MDGTRGIDTTLMRMQDNVRNILGPLTAAWTGLEQDQPTIEKMREHNENMRQQTEKAIILVGKAFFDMTTMRRFSLIDALKKSASRTKRLLSRVQCKKISHTIRKVLREEADKDDEGGMPVESCRQGVTGRPDQADSTGTTALEPEKNLDRSKTMARPKTMAGKQLPCQQETR